MSTMYNPENLEVSVDPEQIDILLKAGWTVEKKDLDAEKAEKVSAKELKAAEKKAAEDAEKKAAEDAKKKAAEDAKNPNILKRDIK